MRISCHNGLTAYLGDIRTTQVFVVVNYFLITSKFLPATDPFIPKKVTPSFLLGGRSNRVVRLAY